MQLKQFKALLSANADKQFLIQMPDKSQVPVSFHITEVGHVSKTFLDCGGKVHTVETCQLQVWVGDDEEHRLNAGKLARILELAHSVVTNDELDVEIEYEDKVISQYPVAEAVVADNSVTLHLTTKHTDCLAKDVCLPPAGSAAKNGSGCCGTALPMANTACCDTSNTSCCG